MAFDTLEITDKTMVLEVETDNGTFWIPIPDAYMPDRETWNYLITLSDKEQVILESDAGQAVLESMYQMQDLTHTREGILKVTKRRGYCARWAMSGYLDCTEWEFHTNRRTLVREMKEAV